MELSSFSLGWSSGEAQAYERARPPGPLDVGLARQDWCDRSSDFSSLVIISPERKGRIRSAERTEVHLITTIRFRELTFCPSNADLGLTKGSSSCR